MLSNSKERVLSRRNLIKWTVAGAAAGLTRPLFAQAVKKRTGMGLVIYDCNHRRRWLRERDPEFDLFEPMHFLRHCRGLGAGGMQATLGSPTTAQVDALNEYAGRNRMFIEAIVRPPKDEDDIARFTADLKIARSVNARAARTVIMPGRRYERFKTLAEFREFEKRGKRMLELAAPVAEKIRMPLAVENHKDQRIEERVALFRTLDSEFIGACVDTGNSFALMDGAYESVEALAPFAFSVHLKDQALQEHRDGFLLGDIPLGQGSFDLGRMVKTLRKAKPDVRFSLELITRDALRVPCLLPEFWATMPNASASDLARTMRFVREHPAKVIQEVSKLSRPEQVLLENSNVDLSVSYAGEVLKI